MAQTARCGREFRPPVRLDPRRFNRQDEPRPQAAARSLVLLGLAVFWFISSQIGGSSSILRELNDTGTARGLITFILTTATVAAAILLVLAAIIRDGPEADLKMRISEGRQVLAPLIGILGTIVGFYFGQAPATSAQPAAQPPRVSVTSSPEQVAPGGVVTVTSSVSGGRPPYTYTITVPGVGSPIAGTLANGGPFKHEVITPADAKPQNGPIVVRVRDGSDPPAEGQAERPLRVSGGGS